MGAEVFQYKSLVGTPTKSIIFCFFFSLLRFFLIIYIGLIPRQCGSELQTSNSFTVYRHHGGL
jgi:hypothetical protein